MDHKASEDLAKGQVGPRILWGTPVTTVSVSWCDC